MSVDIIDFYFALDIIFYYLIFLLIIYAIKYLRTKQSLLKPREIIIPFVALVGIIAILVYALAFDRERIYVVEPYQIPAPAPSQTPQPKRLTVKLNQMNNSNVFGSADLIDNMGNVQIALHIEGKQADVRGSPQIYSGTCKRVGVVKYTVPAMINLPVIKMGSSAKPINLGQMGNFNDLTIGQLIQELPLVIVIHENTDEESNIVSCGPIVKPVDFK